MWHYRNIVSGPLKLVHIMSKPVVHVILPDMAPESLEAIVFARSIESFQRQMYPFEVVVHSSDLAYETKKNPLCGHEAPVYEASSR